MIKLQPLTASLRNMARVSSAEAKAMHVIDEASANLPVLKAKRYNVRVAENAIAKYTLNDNSIDVVYLVKHGDKYVPNCGSFHAF